MKRTREEGSTEAEVVASQTVTAAATPSATSGEDTAAASSGRQYIEVRPDETKLVKNSPYGASRAKLGWGSPFQQPSRCVVEAFPNIHIGLSSLNGVPAKDRDMTRLLVQYVKKFHCLEHCYPYHRMCEPQVWDSWRAMVQKRPDFVFTIKANQYLTHTRRLEMDADVATHIDNFFVQRCPLLGDHLGPVLIQLPPTFQKTDAHVDRLRAVAARIPQSLRIAVEFRHKTWFCDEVYGLLKLLGWGLVVTHNEDIGESPFIITNPKFLYVRLHGAVNQYVGDYGPALMQRWAEIVAKFVLEDRSRHVYFFMNNNESTIGGLTSSVADATCLTEHLQRMLKDAAPLPTDKAESVRAGAPQAEATVPVPNECSPAPSATNAIVVIDE